MKTFLKILFAAIFVWMVFFTIRASLQESLIVAMPAYAKNPWAMATLYDAYCGFITFFVWVACKETAWLHRIVWFFLIMALGNIAMSAYVLIELFRLRPEDGVECLLKKGVKIDVHAMAGLLDRAITQRQESLAVIASHSSALVVFLRHAGCTFCREALADIAGSRREIESSGVRIVLVHMGDIAELEQLLEKHSLQGLDRICDPKQELYRAFGLKRGSLSQLYGPKVWWRGFKAGLLSGHGIGKPFADASQMPGVFLLEQGIIARRFRHRSAADRPDYALFCLKSGEPT